MSRWDVALFGEKQSRIVVTVDRDRMHRLQDLCHAIDVPVSLLGYTGGATLRVDSHDEDGNEAASGVSIPVSEMTAVWTQSLEAVSG